MIVASIDIGTNTVLLLIAEVKNSGELTPILNKYRMPRIGKGIDATGLINSEKLNLLYTVLKEYDSLIKFYNCEKVIVTGTNALRIASNASEVLKTIKNLFKYKIDIISGEEEAEYAYLGATSNLLDKSAVLVIDIGGGSTEIILGEKSEIKFKSSIRIGSVSATEKFLKHSPPQIEEIKILKDEIIFLLKELSSLNSYSNVIATAGTATTLSCMKLGLRDFVEDKVEMSSITIEELNEIIKKLGKLKPSEILEIYGPIMKGREDIILAGAIILFETMIFFGIKNLKVSSWGIRYGAIIKYLKGLNL